MSRGQTWSYEEIKALIDEWSDDNIAELLVTTHKNTEVFKLISGKMGALGFTRNFAQCRNKLKKLRYQYIKIRDMIVKNGRSGVEKHRFPWYDELDAILGARPTCNPQHIVESEEKESPPSPFSSGPSDSDSTEDEQQSEKDKIAPCIKVEETPTTSSPLDEDRGEPAVATPGAQIRKEGTKTDRFERMFESYLEAKKKMDEDESQRTKQEFAAFENFLTMQRQAEERHFQLLQEQQRVSSQMFLQMMGNILRAAVAQPASQPATGQQWPPVCPTNSAPHRSSQPTHHTDPSPSFTAHQDSAQEPCTPQLSTSPVLDDVD
ncbi:zinc finger and SCAN domain-containing protein 20 isoform X2 [Fundulus heteroclitus]|uniref:zinc finger and SCAN domain-containing protein 20 isoform X2 n=1 Tax=Fundulus heteroclitus TaxID=8078 RepID=UPI00165C27AA|nr:zinc finger and SCAN domain-containing protein 20 isoform X2 [Fundulus heteroclitus]